ncbi:MAG: hypothetical protein ACTSRZ_13780 [Promethearchaeota archaeon]
MTSKKLFLIGHPGAGKTCITKAFFEGEDPKKLLSDLGSPEPTLGVEHYKSTWIDIDVGILDSAGQEMERFITGDDIDKEMSFGGSDGIIYVFDIEQWIENKDFILDILKKVIDIKNEYSPDAIIYAFCHKIDLIALDVENRAKIFEDVKNEIQEKMGIKTVFTSIEPRFIHSLFRSMQIILNDLSKRGNKLEAFLKQLILKEKGTALIMLDKSYRIISERRSDDISVVSMYNIITFIKSINKAFQRIDKTDFVLNGVIKSNNNQQILIRGLNNNDYGIKFVIILGKQASMDIVDEVIKFVTSS